MYWTIHLNSGPRLANHASVVIGTNIFAFGGFDSYEEWNTHRSKPIEVCVFDTVSLTWTKLCEPLNEDLSECVLLKRYGHSAAAHGSKVYIFGGQDTWFNKLNTLYCFDTETFTWSRPNVYGNVPTSRDGHSACIIGDYMYVFGGYQVQPNFPNYLYMLDLNTMTWNIIKTKGSPVPCKDFHSSTAIGDKMYIFGGSDHEPRLNGPRRYQNDKYDNDLYVFDIITNTWDIPLVFGPKPAGRRCHSAFEHNGNLYIFGGGNIIQHFQGIHQYNPESSTWKKITTKGMPPCPRSRQICQMVNNRIFISGGISSKNPMKHLECSDIASFMLKNHYDLHVLDLSPSLYDMCLVNLWDYLQKKQINLRDLKLPTKIKNDLEVTNPMKDEDIVGKFDLLRP